MGIRRAGPANLGLAASPHVGSVGVVSRDGNDVRFLSRGRALWHRTLLRAAAGATGRVGMTRYFEVDGELPCGDRELRCGDVELPEDFPAEVTMICSTFVVSPG